MIGTSLDPWSTGSLAIHLTIAAAARSAEPASASKVSSGGQRGQAGIEFIDENGGGPGVRLRKRQRAKQDKSKRHI